MNAFLQIVFSSSEEAALFRSRFLISFYQHIRCAYREKLKGSFQQTGFVLRQSLSVTLSHQYRRSIEAKDEKK